MKYVETFQSPKPIKPIDWTSRIEELDKINEEEQEQWAKDAGSWVTCACGNQCDLIPRSNIGRPEDEKLASLGKSFFLVIVQRNKPSAKAILEEIEKRSAFLVQEIKNKKS